MHIHRHSAGPSVAVVTKFTTSKSSNKEKVKATLICKNYVCEILGRPILENCAPQNFGAVRYYT